MRLIFLTLDKIDFLCLIYLNLCANEIFKFINDHLRTLNIILFAQKFECTKQEISIVSKVKKNQRIPTKHLSEHK